jgi:hypothetical protein
MAQTAQRHLKILIVGAGSLGQVFGFHLHAVGASVNYLVKPARGPAARKGFRLYRHVRRRQTDTLDFVAHDVLTDPQPQSARAARSTRPGTIRPRCRHVLWRRNGERKARARPGSSGRRSRRRRRGGNRRTRRMRERPGRRTGSWNFVAAPDLTRAAADERRRT